MEKISVQFLAPHLWRWVLLILPAIALSFWAYWGILAPLTRPARWALWCLRGCAFLLVLLALGQPVLTAVLRDTGKPRLAVLVDRSASMALPGGGEAAGSSRALEAAALARASDEALKGRYRLQWYAFSDGARAVSPDSVPRDGGNTALGGALQTVLTQADSRPVSGILLFSDGVNTIGQDPVRIASASPVPVFTVPIGSSTPPADVEVRRVRTNPTAFLGEPLPIQTVLSSWGMAGRTVRLEVAQGGQVVAQKEVQLLGDRGLEQEVDLEVRPSGAGLTLYDVRVTGVRDSVPQNDLRQVAVEVLERKTRVLLLAGRLDWDFSFARRTLAADTTLAYTFLVQERPGLWREAGTERTERLPSSDAELRDYAAVVILGCGQSGLPPATANALARFVRSGGGLFLAGGPSGPGGWVPSGDFASVLPATIAPDPLPAVRALPVALTLEGQRHPATAVRDNPAETAELWASLPPLARPGGALQPKPEARTLLEYRNARGGPLPALAVSFADRGKAAWLYGEGFWRWGFLPAGGPAPHDLYPQFLVGLVRWLAEPAVRERFQVTPAKRVYQNGEAIAFAASLWNAAYAPVPDARVTVEVRAAADSSASAPLSAVALRPGTDPGGYDGDGSALPPGPYVFRAQAVDGSGRELDRARGRFWVEAMGPEFSRTSTDREALAEIAARSGGAIADPAGLRDLLEKIPRAMRHVGRIKEIEIWNHWLLFVSFVTVLSAEWFLRRRRGLA